MEREVDTGVRRVCKQDRALVIQNKEEQQLNYISKVVSVSHEESFATSCGG